MTASGPAVDTGASEAPRPGVRDIFRGATDSPPPKACVVRLGVADPASFLTALPPASQTSSWCGPGVVCHGDFPIAFMRSPSPLLLRGRPKVGLRLGLGVLFVPPFAAACDRGSKPGLKRDKLALVGER